MAHVCPNSSVERSIADTSRNTRCRSATACRSSTFRRSVTSSYEPPSRYSNRKCGNRAFASARKSLTDAALRANLGREARVEAVCLALECRPGEQVRGKRDPDLPLLGGDLG